MSPTHLLWIEVADVRKFFPGISWEMKRKELQIIFAELAHPARDTLAHSSTRRSVLSEERKTTLAMGHFSQRRRKLPSLDVHNTYKSISEIPVQKELEVSKMIPEKRSYLGFDGIQVVHIGLEFAHSLRL